MRFWKRSTGRSGMSLRPAGEGFPRSASPLERAQDLAAILCHAEERVIGNDYTFSFAGQPLSDPAGTGPGGHAAPAPAGGTSAGRDVERLAIRAVIWRSKSAARAPSRLTRTVAQTAAQGSQCRRQERLDAGLLRPPRSSAVECDRRLKINPFGRRAFLNAQSLRSGVSPKQWSRPGRALLGDR